MKETKTGQVASFPLPPDLVANLKTGYFTIHEDDNGRALYPTRFINETTSQVADLLRGAIGAEDASSRLEAVFAAMDEHAKPGENPEIAERAKRILVTEVLFNVLGLPAENYPPRP